MLTYLRVDDDFLYEVDYQLVKKLLKKSKLSVTTTMLTYLRVDDDFLYEVDYQPVMSWLRSCY